MLPFLFAVAFAVVWAVEAAPLRSETAMPCGLGPARLRVRALGLLRCSPHGWLGLRQIHALTALGLQCVVGAGAGWASAPCRAASVRLPAPASPGGPLGPFVWVPPACLAGLTLARPPRPPLSVPWSVVRARRRGALGRAPPTRGCSAYAAVRPVCLPAAVCHGCWLGILQQWGGGRAARSCPRSPRRAHRARGR